jgi:hypothetical protein
MKKNLFVALILPFFIFWGSVPEGLGAQDNIGSLDLNRSNPNNSVIPFFRSVLVIYYGKNRETDDENNFRKYWDFPLNDLGLKARYRNMRKGFPSLDTLARTRAVFFQFDDNAIPHPGAFWRFVNGLLDRRIKVVFLESFPEDLPGGMNRAEVNGLRDRALARMGLKIEGSWDTNSFALDYGVKDLKMEGFEYPLPQIPSEFHPLVSTSPKNRIFLSVTSTDSRNQGLQSIYAVAGVWGGMVFDPFMIRWPILDETHTLWYINPFRFLERVLDIEKTPRMDLTTLNGMRIFYSQVDGDAFDTLSRYERRRMSAEVLYQEIFQKVDLPFTVSVITSQIDPRYQGTKSRIFWARKIFALPNVEAGSHTFSHPFYWVPTKKQKDEGPIHIEIPHYKLDLKTEINGSIDWINHNLLPPGKKVMLLQWSGDTRPGRAALAQLATTSVLNINGSDTRFDDNAPSYTFVFPYFRKVDGYTQYFNSDVNDYILTNDWRGPYFGYLNVIRTFERTNRPRRVDPINVYFHFYAGQRESSLNALKQVLAWVLKQNIAPVFSSGFVRIEQGYIGAHFQQRKSVGREVSWQVSDYGKDTTVRFDHADMLFPEIASGVIGFRHLLGSLYVYLAPDKKRATITLSQRYPGGPWLSRSTGYVRMDGACSRMSIHFVYEGWVPKDRVVWKGLSPSTLYRLSDKTSTGVRKGVFSLRSDPSGTLSLDHLDNGVEYSLDREK